jgi:PPE-repeat protein
VSIDYGAEIPEVNSGRIYTGAGSGPLMATAAAWAEQAGELMAGAAQLAGVLGTLSANWQGPSSEAAVASIMPYLAWMLKSAATAEHAATTHAAVAAAHEAAFMGVVPPPVIAANQSALAAAIGGLPWTAPLVAQLEAQYQEMWAQDSTALYAYAASMTTAIGGLQADPFTPALPTTTDGGLGAVADASGQAAGESAGNAAQTASGAGNQAASMGSAASSLGGIGSSAGQALSAPMNSLGQAGQSLTSPLTSAMSQFGQFANPAMTGMGTGMLGGLAGFGGGFGGGAGGVGSFGGMPAGGGGYGPMLASMGRAASLPSGRLSVPASWAGSVEPSAARPLVNSTMSAAPIMSNQPEAFASGTPSRMYGGVPMMAGAGAGGGTATHTYPTDSLGSLGQGKGSTGKPLPRLRASVMNTDLKF